MNWFHLLVVLSAIALSVQEAYGDFDDFCTLNGNVRGLKEFNHIQVKLFNKNGNLKETTEVSESGFFVLPIYDKGEYTIRVSAPLGFSFDPEEIPFNFDGVNDLCTTKKDANFQFKGFGITGKVNIFNAPSNVGAKGVNIKLSNDKNQVIRETTTDDNGIYTFSPIVPGSYAVSASHESWYFAKSEHSVTVTTGNTELPENSLLVSGFSLNGRVKTDSTPTIRMGFLIYNLKNQQNRHQCDEKLPTGDVTQKISNEFEPKPLCFSYAGKTGEFSFKNLANGRYLIVPYVDKNSIEFHITPSSMETAINKDNTQLDKNFQVSGFSVSGRVLLSQKNNGGINGAMIKLNGKEVAKTAKDGSYTLKNIKDGTYTIQVTANDLQFQDHTVKISMSDPTIPDIFASGFKACGKVVSDRSFRVAIKKDDSTFSTESNSDPEQGGSFCMFLSNGKYTLEVIIDDEERRSGLQFYPIQQTIEINSASVNDVIFSQLRAKVTGVVSCLSDEENSCRSIDVTLNSLDENRHQIGSLKASLANGTYAFEEVLPGRYQLSVPAETLCWDSNKQTIIIKSTVENVPKFVQNGYKIGPIISSHNALASYKLRGSPVEGQKSVEKSNVELTSGVNVLCVPRAGVYDLKVTGCHIFEEDKKELTTKNPSPVNINAIRHRNSIRILSEIYQKYTIDVEYNDGTKEVLKPVEQKEKEDGYVSYKLELDLKPDEKVKLTPKNEQMLFKPSFTELKGAGDCKDDASNFIATKGLVIAGKTEPAISQVQVTLTFPKNPGMPALGALTNDFGEFKFPTIDPTIDYELRAEKESYTFSDYDTVGNIFLGHKLCEIIVQVRDEEAKELSNVVISLNGVENYRKTMQTTENGEIKFHSLKPGKYYLRAMMKEYDFTPNSQTIDIQDGQTLNIDLKGKRVAYSVFGKITTLSGDPFGDVKVEAVSTSEACSNHQEEATTEANGLYRIRGLQTGCDYRIRLGQNDNVDRSMPSERPIHVETADALNVNFIAVIPIRICDVIVKIKSKNNDHYKSLKIQMFRKDSPDTPFYTQRIENLMLPKSKSISDVMVFMPRIGANDFQKNFFIELTTTLSDKNYKLKLDTIHFTANMSRQYFELEFNPILRQPESELNKNSLAALFLIFIVGFVFFKQELVIEVAKNLMARLNSEMTSSKQTTKKSEGRADHFVDEKEMDQLAEFIEEKKKKKSKKSN